MPFSNPETKIEVLNLSSKTQKKRRELYEVLRALTASAPLKVLSQMQHLCVVQGTNVAEKTLKVDETGVLVFVRLLSGSAIMMICFFSHLKWKKRIMVENPKAVVDERVVEVAVAVVRKKKIKL